MRPDAISSRIVRSERIMAADLTGAAHVRPRAGSARAVAGAAVGGVDDARIEDALDRCARKSGSGGRAGRYPAPARESDSRFRPETSRPMPERRRKSGARSSGLTGRTWPVEIWRWRHTGRSAAMLYQARGRDSSSTNHSSGSDCAMRGPLLKMPDEEARPRPGNGRLARADACATDARTVVATLPLSTTWSW